MVQLLRLVESRQRGGEGMRVVALVLAGMALVLLLASGVAWAAKIRCEPGSTTFNPCVGTNNPNIIRGTIGSDVIIGGTDRDTIYGYAKNDFIDGWRGRDRLYGGRGADTLSGNKGRDICRGGTGNDKFFSCEIKSGQP
jgi:Ca2+-binding RTX toxin-like protein